jgi:hypothetical protein
MPPTEFRIKRASCKSRHPRENGDPVFLKTGVSLDSRLRENDDQWSLGAFARASKETTNAKFAMEPKFIAS